MALGVEEPIPTEPLALTTTSDAPVEEDMTIKITFGDLNPTIQSAIMDKILKNEKAVDDISRNNLISELKSTPIFDGTVDEFKTKMAIDNK